MAERTVTVVLVWHLDSVPDMAGDYLVELTSGANDVVRFDGADWSTKQKVNAWARVPNTLGTRGN
jgi:hypothetical protein